MSQDRHALHGERTMTSFRMLQATDRLSLPGQELAMAEGLVLRYGTVALPQRSCPNFGTYSRL